MEMILTDPSTVTSPKSNKPIILKSLKEINSTSISMAFEWVISTKKNLIKSIYYGS